MEASCLCIPLYMTEAEQRYAQIEKEALATTWACEKFSNYMYLLGRHFDIETDHKPLVPLLSSKHLDDLPPCVLRFRLQLARYDYSFHMFLASCYTQLILCHKLLPQ